MQVVREAVVGVLHCSVMQPGLFCDPALHCTALLQELGLPVDSRAPLLGFIGRLDHQKGVDMIVQNFEWLMDQVRLSHALVSQVLVGHQRGVDMAVKNCGSWTSCACSMYCDV